MFSHTSVSHSVHEGGRDVPRVPLGRMGIFGPRSLLGVGMSRGWVYLRWVYPGGEYTRPHFLCLVVATKHTVGKQAVRILLECVLV